MTEAGEAARGDTCGSPGGVPRQGRAGMDGGRGKRKADKELGSRGAAKQPRVELSYRPSHMSSVKFATLSTVDFPFLNPP